MTTTQDAPAPKTDKLLIAAQIVASAIFLIGAVGKVTDPTAPDNFERMGLEVFGGRVLIGLLELAVALMLWRRATAAIAAMLGALVMTGAIAAHLFTPLGILIDGDPSLFMMALLAFSSFVTVLVKRHRELPGLETSLEVAAVSFGALGRNLTLRFVVVGIASMVFVAVTMMAIVLVQDVQTNQAARDRVLGTSAMLLAGGADPANLPDELELLTGDQSPLISSYQRETAEVSLVEGEKHQPTSFPMPDGRRGAFIQVEDGSYVVVAEKADLSLTILGGDFTARAILAWFVIAPALMLFWFLAARVTSNIRALAQAAERFGAGDYETPIKARGEDEIARLAKVFEHARSSISGFIDEVLGAFPGLLLPVSRDGVIGEHISKRSQDLLAQPAGKTISNALFNGNDDFSSMLELAVGDDSDISFDDLMSLAPQRVEVGGRTWQLTYAPNHSRRSTHWGLGHRRRHHRTTRPCRGGGCRARPCQHVNDHAQQSRALHPYAGRITCRIRTVAPHRDPRGRCDNAR